MSSLAAKLANRFTSSARFSSSIGVYSFGRVSLENIEVAGVQRSSKLCYSATSLDDDNDGGDNGEADFFQDDFVPAKRELVPQGVDPKKGWNFRGVHKAIICGKVRQTPVQKLLRNGRTLTIFNVGTGGMWDQRLLGAGAKDMPKPAQWHRIVVHNESLGAYAVQQLVKNSSVYVEGDIEIRVYNKGITGEVVRLPEVCVRYDGFASLSPEKVVPIFPLKNCGKGCSDFKLVADGRDLTFASLIEA